MTRLAEYFAAAKEPGATNAVLFGLYAMLLYMSDTLGDDLRDRLKVRLWFARRARDIGKRNADWDSAPKVSPPWREITAWVAVLSLNRPAQLVRPPMISDVIHIDACGLGYAALVVPHEGKPYLLQQRWSPSEVKRLSLHRSVNSEPEAVIRVSEHLSAMGRGGRHLYVSDHEQFAKAVAKGHSLSSASNERLRRLAPWSVVVYEPGNLSIADPYSRFRAHALSDEDAKEAARRARVYAAACSRGNAYGIVGCGRSDPARVFQEHPPK